MTETIPLSAARRIALAAQGFADRQPAADPERRHLKRVVERIGLIQIDSVNVLARAHTMPPFSRLGPYPGGLLDNACAGRRRMFFEYWAHEASLLPLELWPLMRWRMDKAARGKGIYGGLARFAEERGDFVEQMFARIERDGAMAASDFDGDRGEGGWWGWSDAKRALEFLFWAGRLTTAHRRPSFERVYDLPERVLPAAVVEAPVPAPAEAHRELMRIAARALGVATLSELRDYFRLSPDEARPALESLVEEGALVPVAIRGVSQQAWLDPAARRPRKVKARALLAPFDPLIWERGRAERLFGFHYRIEIYTPADKRRHGYYVFPFLLGDRLVARVDLKADRQAGVLMVQSAFAEDHAPPGTAAELAAELAQMAGWLGLSGISVAPRGDLSAALRDACAKLT